MSHSFGSASLSKLATCHQSLQDIAERALETCPYDFTIVHGWRGEDVQNALFDSGASTKRFPDSKHNVMDELDQPMSMAIDFAPWINGDIPWKETHIFACIAGHMQAAAFEFGEKLRWGGDWDTDGLTTDQTLMDWGHVELVE